MAKKNCVLFLAVVVKTEVGPYVSRVMNLFNEVCVVEILIINSRVHVQI